MRASSRAKISQLQATRYLFDTNNTNELTDELPSLFKMLVLALEITLLSNSLGSSIVLNKEDCEYKLRWLPFETMNKQCAFTPLEDVISSKV